MPHNVAGGGGGASRHGRSQEEWHRLPGFEPTARGFFQITNKTPPAAKASTKCYQTASDAGQALPATLSASVNEPLAAGAGTHVHIGSRHLWCASNNTNIFAAVLTWLCACAAAGASGVHYSRQGADQGGRHARPAGSGSAGRSAGHRRIVARCAGTPALSAWPCMLECSAGMSSCYLRCCTVAPVLSMTAGTTCADAAEATCAKSDTSATSM
jgi:hypothetical protein